MGLTSFTEYYRFTDDVEVRQVLHGRASMRAFGKAILYVAIAILVVVATYRLFYPKYFFNYRMTVEVEVDGEVRQASNVFGVYWEKTPTFLSVGTHQRRAFGQALLVDLEEHGCILIPVNTNTNVPGESTSVIPFLVFLADEPPAYRGPPHTADRVRKTMRSRGRVKLREDILPQFIWLPDKNDYASARVLSAEEFSKAIGSAVQLRGVWIEITKDSVTYGLEKKLPWLNEMYPPATTHVMRLPGAPAFYWVPYALWREKSDL
ncbi:hypothetical protein [Parvibaculum lavamentivorans]|nr:hypothetical protein [Parvibaculum lavamentivorans]